MGKSKDYSKPLTDEEYEQMQKDHAKLKALYEADPAGTLEAVKDAIDFGSKSGDLED